MAFDLSFSRDFIAAAKLPKKHPVRLGAAAPEPVSFEDVKQQAMVAGADLIAFEEGVASEFREAIADSSLLAQFVANATTPATQDPIGWFNSYFGALTNFGWVEQSRDTAKYEIRTDGLEVHKAIIDVITAYLAPVGPTALKLVTVALESLLKMDEDSPLITIFNRESQHAEVGRFQVTLVMPDKISGGLMAQAVAFALTAERKITQILFFKLSNTKASLRRSQGTVSIDTQALGAVLPALKAKLQAHQANYIASIPLPALAGAPA